MTDLPTEYSKLPDDPALRTAFMTGVVLSYGNAFRAYSEAADMDRLYYELRRQYDELTAMMNVEGVLG